MKKTLTAMTMFLACHFSFAAMVQWNFVDMVDSGGKAFMQTNLLDGRLPFSLFFSLTTTAENTRLQGFDCNLMTSISVKLADNGDIVGGSLFESGSSLLFSTEKPGATGETSVGNDKPFYLAFQVFEMLQDEDPEMGLTPYYKGTAHYGWLACETDADGRIELLASAIDLDGDAIVAGGGNAPIPEPASWLQFGFGLALIVLRRRREIPEPGYFPPQSVSAMFR